MSDNDNKDLIVSHVDTLPYLLDAIRLAHTYKREGEVKPFLEFLLGVARNTLVNEQPRLFIDPEVWTEFMRNGFHQCVYRDTCRSKQCLGLNTAYTRRFCWMENVLTPFPLVESSDS